MIGYRGKKYIFNIDEICKFFIYSDINEFKEKEVTDAFEADDEGGFAITSKIVRETRVPGNGTIDNIKYDFIKLLLSQAMAIRATDIENLGTQIVMDTLIANNFLIEYNE